MAGKAAQSRSPRDAGGGRAQRCAPSAREFWRRRRVREECRRAPLAGGGRGKFSGAGAAVPATAIGIQPCNRELCPMGRADQSSPCRHRPTPDQKFGGRDPRCRRRFTADAVAARKRRAGFWDDPSNRRHRTDPATATGRHALWQKRPGHTPNPARGIPASPPRTSNRPAGRPRASPKTATAITPTAWCAAAR